MQFIEVCSWEWHLREGRNRIKAEMQACPAHRLAVPWSCSWGGLSEEAGVCNGQALGTGCHQDGLYPWER